MSHLESPVSKEELSIEMSDDEVESQSPVEEPKKKKISKKGTQFHLKANLAIQGSRTKAIMKKQGIKQVGDRPLVVASAFIEESFRTFLQNAIRKNHVEAKTLKLSKQHILEQIAEDPYFLKVVGGSKALC